MNPVTYSLKLVSDLTKDNPHVKMTKCHATGSGMRMVLDYDYDPGRQYEVLINPIYPDQGKGGDVNNG